MAAVFFDVDGTLVRWTDGYGAVLETAVKRELGRADSAWLEENMAEPTYRRYLRWAHAGPVDVGEEWDEFVNCGCTNPEDVVLRVEAVEGGTGIGADTTIDVVPRKKIVEGTVEIE